MKAGESMERIKAGAGPKPVPRSLRPSEAQGVGRKEGCEAPRGEDSGVAASQDRSLLPTESEGTGRKEGCEAPSREDGPEGDTAAAKPATQRGAGCNLRKAWSSSGFSYGPECKAENTPVLR